MLLCIAHYVGSCPVARTGSAYDLCVTNSARGLWRVITCCAGRHHQLLKGNDMKSNGLKARICLRPDIYSTVTSKDGCCEGVTATSHDLSQSSLNTHLTSHVISTVSSTSYLSP